MIIAFLAGAGIGFFLALFPGPLGVTAIQFGLSQKLRLGVQLVLGAAIMDLLFCAIAIFATSAVKTAALDFSAEHPFIMILFQALIVVGFVIFGLITMRAKNGKVDLEEAPIEKSKYKFIEDMKTKGPFLLGVAIALTNIPSPTFLPILASVSLAAHERELCNTIFEKFSFAFGFGFGNFLWLYILVRLVNRFKAKMSTMMITRIRQAAGLSFIGFGALVGYRLVTLTHWSEFLRFVFVI